MRAGPKVDPGGEPIDFSRLGKDRGRRAATFIETYLSVPKGVGALSPVVLRPWQRNMIHGLFQPEIRQGLWSLPRGNTKSTMAAMLALFGLFADQEEGARVLCVAGSERQAALVYDTCRRMVELSPELAGLTQVHVNRLVVPSTDSVLTTTPARAAGLQGHDPSFVVIDELAIVPWDVYESMSLAMGKRPRSLLLSISTSPVEQDSAMHKLRELGLAGDDPTFQFVEFSAPAGCAIDDEEAWALANPALDDMLSRDALRSDLRKVREASFRRFRLNQTVSSEGAWLEWGQFEALADMSRTVPPKARIVVGFDGSVSGDSTAIVCATVEAEPYVWLHGLWEAPSGPPTASGWSVPRQEVTEALAALYDRFTVVETAADPFYWRDTVEAWSARWPGTVIEFPTHTTARMAPATDLAYSLISEGRMSHSGDERLCRHVRNCVVRQSVAGDMVAKDHKSSPRRIDAAVAMIIALARASWWVNQPKRRNRVFIGSY